MEELGVDSSGAVLLDLDENRAKRAGSKALIGKLVSDKLVNRNTVRNMIQKSWNMVKGLTISEVSQNVFLFSFDEEEDCKRIVREGPWAILGRLLIVKPWSPEIAASDLDLDSCLFWVQLHGLPLEGISVGNAVKLGSVAGRVVAVEDPFENGKISRTFVRVRVLMDIKRALSEGVMVKRPSRPISWVEFKYERLQQFCYHCGIIGHDYKQCKKDKELSQIHQGKNKFGAWLGTNSVKPLHKILEVDANGLWAGEDAFQEVGQRKEIGNQDEVLGLPKGPMEKLGLPEATATDVCGQETRLGSPAPGALDLGKQKGSLAGLESGGLDADSLAKQPMKVCSKSNLDCCNSSLEFKLGRVKRKFVSKARGSHNTAIEGKSNNYFVELPVDEEMTNSCLAIVPVATTSYEQKLISGIKRINLKWKVPLEDSPPLISKVRKIAILDSNDTLRFDKESPPVKEKKSRSPGSRKLVNKDLLSFHFEENLVDVPVVLLKDFNSQEGFVFGSGGIKVSNAEVEPIGLAGGLALFWMDSVRLSIVSASKNLIHTEIVDGLLQFSGFISFIYGPPLDADRSSFWCALRSRCVPAPSHWICIGDLNEISGQSEKFGGRIHSCSKFLNLQEFLIDCDMVDFGFKGSKYTWSNGRLGSRHVKERLDRGLFNVQCRTDFPNAYVFHLPFAGSDHCPILLDLDFKDVRTPREFKFEVFWLDHPDFLHVVSEAWKFVLEREESCWCSFLAKLDKYVFREGAFDEEKSARAKAVLKQLEAAWDREEKYWWQRSRVKWLEAGDSNSCFFHASTIQRRAHNKILRLKDEAGSWREDHDGIADCVSSYFEKIFAHSGTRDMSDVLLFVEKVITEEDNELLNGPVTSSEIKETAFQLGGMKAPGPDGVSGFFYHNSWDIIGDQVILAVRDFFANGCEIGDINVTNIVLIPKSNNPKAVLSLMVFSDKWVDLTLKCVSSVRYNLLLSGRKVAEVLPKRGLRQGDPLSPYLFIIVADVLSNMIRHFVTVGDLKGIKLARNCPVLSHYFFTDDSLFFLQANRQNCEKMKWILDAYCLASGQEANLDKSCLFFSPNSPTDLKDEIIEVSIFRMALSLMPGRVLEPRGPGPACLKVGICC
ncbi:reverse transcriptase [Senna tora]|uniref:Reverse transcriptase n=1 Tax=Senna tora TaxID=362788 RepID=A0A834W9K4_9FABA|nr:reverse transcriptase [Senna tora]